MNILHGKIEQILQEGDVVLCKVRSKGEIFGTLMLNVDLLDGARVGANVELLFKESEVLLASVHSQVSARMACVSKILNIKKGKILWQVFLDFQEEILSSIITAEAGEFLQLKVGENVLWFVKSTEIILRIPQESLENLEDSH